MRKSCEICTPTCIRTCPISASRAGRKRKVFCTSCGQPIDGISGKCPECGEVIETICPECLCTNTFLDGRCTVCGFAPKHIDVGPSIWYRHEVDDMRGTVAPLPGETG